MKKFKITIEEVVSEEFEVTAESVEDAVRIAEKKYNSGEFVLEPGNLTGKRLSVNDSDKWIEF